MNGISLKCSPFLTARYSVLFSKAFRSQYIEICVADFVGHQRIDFLQTIVE